MKYNYQLIIIGAGSSGLTAADVCIELGLDKVLLIEKDADLGGECLHSGCVPSKALLHAAKTATSKDSQQPWNHVKSCIEQIKTRSDNDDHYSSHGLKVSHGEVTFIDKHTLAFEDGSQVTSKYFLIATGSKPQVPSDIEGIEKLNYYTNETIFTMDEAPNELVIIGGGPIGCEMATAFAMLGTKVTIIQKADRLLPREEPRASTIVTNSLHKLGVTIIFNSTAIKVNSESNNSLHVTSNTGDQTLSAAHVLIAAGRIPIMPKGLDTIGLATTKDGISINKYLQTNHSHIYAVGDCTPSPKFTHLAGHQASLALRNMLSPFKKSAENLQIIPWITYTEPEVAHIGISSEQAMGNDDYQILEMQLTDIDRAITDDNTEGYVTVIIDKAGLIAGATIVAKNANELLGPLCLLYYQRRPITDFSNTVIAYPTLANGLNTLALRYSSAKIKDKSYWNYIARAWRK